MDNQITDVSIIKDKFASENQVFKKDIKVYGETNAAEKIAISSSAPEKDLVGYQKVQVADGVAAGNITGVKAIYNVKEYVFQRPQDNGSSITCGTGFWEVVGGQEYTCVKISNKTDVSKFNGSNTVKKLSKVSGSFKAGNGSSVKNIAGFATVTLDGTIVNGSVKIDMTKNDSETYSFKNKKKKILLWWL